MRTLRALFRLDHDSAIVCCCVLARQREFFSQSQLALLSTLVFLDISGNDFVGTISPSLFMRMSALQGLVFGSNNFSGSFPATIFQMSTLSELRSVSKETKKKMRSIFVTRLSSFGSSYGGASVRFDADTAFPADFSKLGNLRSFDASFVRHSYAHTFSS